MLFFFFATMTILPVVYLIFTRNIIRAAFALVISLLGLAALYVLLNSELMAVVQILIYAGGVMVLLIFGVMLTKRSAEDGVFTAHRNLLISGVGASTLFVALCQLIGQSGLSFDSNKLSSVDQVKSIGVLLLTDHLIAFELVAFVLLVALVGAAFLSKKSADS